MSQTEEKSESVTLTKESNQDLFPNLVTTKYILPNKYSFKWTSQSCSVKICGIWALSIKNFSALVVRY